MRGQISIELNWIFVLIVGAVLLGFFIMLIQNQNKGAMVEEANELILNLDTVLSTVSNEPNAVQSFRIPQAKIDFTCEPGLQSGGISQYMIQNTGPVPTTYDIIFTQQRLNGNEISIWTKMWNTPYPTATFTYMANERTLFVFVNMSDDSVPGDLPVHSLYKQLPSAFRKTALLARDIDDFDASGYDKYFFIINGAFTRSFANSIPQSFKDRGRVQIRGVTPHTDGITGTLSFATVFESPVEVDYYHEELLWGGIFSENRQFYECGKEKAFFRFDIITRILQERAEMIKDELLTSNCHDFFVSYSLKLKDQLDQADNYDAMALANNEKDIENIQQRLLRDVACPYLY